MSLQINLKLRDVKSQLVSQRTCFTRLDGAPKGMRLFVHFDEWYNVFTLFPLRIKRTSLVNNAAEQTREWLWRRASAKRPGPSNRTRVLTHGSVRGTINRSLSNRRIDIQHSSRCKTDARTLRSSTIVVIIKRMCLNKMSRESQKSWDHHYREIETSSGSNKAKLFHWHPHQLSQAFYARLRCVFFTSAFPLFLSILWYSYCRLICYPIKLVDIR